MKSGEFACARAKRLTRGSITDSGGQGYQKLNLSSDPGPLLSGEQISEIDGKRGVLGMHLKELFLTRKCKFVGSSYNAAVPTLFMHIPKTSGLALTRGLRRALAPNRAIEGCFDRVLFGTFRDFDTFAPSERRRIYVEADELPADRDFVSGHFAFSTLLQRYGSANHLTVLREPLSRILSHWLYWRSVPESDLALLGTWAAHVRQAHRSLRDFLSSNEVACTVDNVCVRMLLWPDRLIPQGGFIEPRHDKVLLNQAIERLSVFSFTDVMENPDMPAHLRTWLGKPLTYLPLNETTQIPLPLQRPLHNELTPDTIDLMERRTRLDVKLWELLVAARGMEPAAVRRGAILRNVARHASLMDRFAATQLS
jgi:hypothetical protein